MNHKAVYNLYPNVVKIIHDVAYDANDNEVIVNINEVNTWVDPEQYKYQRANEYPSIADQLDSLYHKGYDGWKAEIEAIKNKYPKGAV